MLSLNRYWNDDLTGLFLICCFVKDNLVIFTALFCTEIALIYDI